MGVLLLLVPIAAVMAPFMLVFEGANLVFGPFIETVEMWAEYLGNLI